MFSSKTTWHIFFYYWRFYFGNVSLDYWRNFGNVYLFIYFWGNYQIQDKLYNIIFLAILLNQSLRKVFELCICTYLFDAQ